MTLYAVLWDDRHVDPSIHLFSNRDDAIKWARDTAEENSYDGYQPEWEPEPGHEWHGLYFSYAESCDLRVFKVEVDAEIAVVEEVS